MHSLRPKGDQGMVVNINIREKKGRISVDQLLKKIKRRADYGNAMTRNTSPRWRAIFKAGQKRNMVLVRWVVGWAQE